MDKGFCWTMLVPKAWASSPQAQRDAVSLAEAEAAFAEGRLTDAARLWGRVTAAAPSFEEVLEVDPQSFCAVTLCYH